MKSGTKTALIGGAMMVGALALPQAGFAADKRTDIDCAELFKQLNTSNSGQLSASEAAVNPIARAAYNDPTVAQRGYLTESEFTAVCVGTDQTPASGQS